MGIEIIPHKSYPAPTPAQLAIQQQMQQAMTEDPMKVLPLRVFDENAKPIDPTGYLLVNGYVPKGHDNVYTKEGSRKETTDPVLLKAFPESLGWRTKADPALLGESTARIARDVCRLSRRRNLAKAFGRGKPALLTRLRALREAIFNIGQIVRLSWRIRFKKYGTSA